MSHCKMYNLHAIKNPENAFEEEDDAYVYEQMLHVADYVTELGLNEEYAEALEAELKHSFGNENVMRNGFLFTVKRAGVDYFFQRLKDWLINTIEKIKERPARQLMDFDLEYPGWWQIKDFIDNSYGFYFKTDGEGWEPITRFAETIYYLCKTHNDKEIVLELRQVFDYHY